MARYGVQNEVFLAFTHYPGSLEVKPMFEQDSSATFSVGFAIAEPSAVRRGTTPGVTAAGPDRSRALFLSLFVVSLAAHATLALRMGSAASGNLARRVRSEVEIEVTRPPPPPVPPVVPPEPIRTAPPERPVLRRVASRAVERPLDAPQQADVSGPEGTEDPTPPSNGDGPVSPIPIPAPPPPPPLPIIEAREGANYLKNPRPAYPHLAQREGWQGVVLLRVQVQPDGRVGSIALERSSGRSILDDAARSAVEGWAFVPATRGGLPTSGWVSVPVEFRLQ
jgi:protein TonB